MSRTADYTLKAALLAVLVWLAVRQNARHTKLMGDPNHETTLTARR
ncbi:hypothetical protein GCM10027299_09560 [Larkinella ripae]